MCRSVAGGECGDGEMVRNYFIQKVLHVQKFIKKARKSTDADESGTLRLKEQHAA